MAIPNNVIKLSRNQKAEYVSGSRAKGWFIYSLQIIKTKGLSLFSFLFLQKGEAVRIVRRRHGLLLE